MSKPSFLDRLAGLPLVGDGAMGTELQRAGLPIGECGDRWVVDHPDRVLAIHRAYVEAGSELLTTNSFGANPWVLERYGLADRLVAINRAAASLAREAAGDRAWVLGDIGPCGGFLRPLGEIDPDRLLAAFTSQATALLEGGADAIIVETMTALDELEVAVRAARAAGAPAVIASLAFDRLPIGQVKTMMGVSPEQGARVAARAGADVIGANCGTRMGFSDFGRVVAGYRHECDLPVMIQANAGSPELVDVHAVYRMTPEEFAEGMVPLLGEGAKILGGCCGTRPDHLAALARAVGGGLPATR